MIGPTGDGKGHNVCSCVALCDTSPSADKARVIFSGAILAWRWCRRWYRRWCWCWRCRRSRDAPLYGLIEQGALKLRNFKLERTGLATPIPARVRTRTPRGSTVDFGQVGELSKRAAVAKRDVDYSVVHQCGERVHDGSFLSTAWRTRGDKYGGKLACQGALGPELACCVPKGLPLSGEVTITGGNAKEESVEFRQLVGGNDGVVWFRRSVHLGEDFIWESLWDLVNFSRAASCDNALLDGFGERGDMAVHGVDDDSDPWGRHVE